MVWDGGSLRQKPNRGQSDEHPGSSVCHVALPSCPGEAINLPIEYLSFLSAMVWLWVTVVASRRAYRTWLCTVPWLVLGNQCTEGCQCPPSWEELRFGTSPSWGWSCKWGWFCPSASSISSISFDDDNLWELPQRPLYSCRTTVCSLQRQRTRHDANERMLCWMKMIKESAFLTWTQRVCSAKARRGLKNVFLLPGSFWIL